MICTVPCTQIRPFKCEGVSLHKTDFLDRYVESQYHTQYACTYANMHKGECVVYIGHSLLISCTAITRVYTNHVSHSHVMM